MPLFVSVWSTHTAFVEKSSRTNTADICSHSSPFSTEKTDIGKKELVNRGLKKELKKKVQVGTNDSRNINKRPPTHSGC